MSGYIVIYLILGSAALATLFLCENSSSARGVVSAMLGASLVCTLAQLLPEWWEALPDIHMGSGWRRRRITMLLATALATAACYPLVSRWVYPLRDRMMEAFDRHYGKKR